MKKASDFMTDQIQLIKDLRAELEAVKENVAPKKVRLTAPDFADFTDAEVAQFNCRSDTGACLGCGVVQDHVISYYCGGTGCLNPDKKKLESVDRSFFQFTARVG
jgi:hypothetical protein